MNILSNNSSPATLVSAIEENLFSWRTVFGKLGTSFKNNPVGVSRSITNIPISLFNSVMETHLEHDRVDEAIDTILTDAMAHNVPILWWLGPSTQPNDLGSYLEKHNFILDEVSPGMAIILDNLKDDLTSSVDVSIQLASDIPSWTHWTTAMFFGFEIPSSAHVKARYWIDLLNLADPTTIFAYIGWLEGKPVATSLLFLAAGVAGIYSVATLPEARGKGIGAYMTWYPLMMARDMGYKVGVLQSSEMGFNVYRSLGFQEYCKIFSYLWKPA